MLFMGNHDSHAEGIIQFSEEDVTMNNEKKPMTKVED